MTYQVLARKWRPKVFGEVIGQEHVTKTLQNSVKKQQIAHAYLLTGTRGVGKTTIARIFAKAIRCENLTDSGDPCLTCAACTSIDDGSSLDYLEIDGASNTGVDNIRELIDNVQYLPTTGAHKVYVIDEVHMLTVNAFNALLKTLEEPPKHVVFIFATTDPQKLLGTVLSRCQRFDFKNVLLDVLVNHIKKISESESINFENDSLIFELAKQGKGSVRDTLSLLDQVLSLSIDRNITESNLLLSLGLANTRSIGQIMNAIVTGDKDLCVKSYNEALNENVDLSKFSLQILDKIFYVIENIDSQGNIDGGVISSEALETISLSEILWVYETLARDIQWALGSIDPEKMVLFTLAKVCLRKEIFDIDVPAISIKKKELVAEQSIQEQPVEQIIVQQPEEVIVPIPVVEKDLTWDGFIEEIKKSHKSLAANLERGNILGEFSFSKAQMNIEVGFTEENKIFLDFLKENDARKTIKEELANFFEIELNNIEVILSLVDDQTKEKRNFKSRVEIEEHSFNLQQEEKKQNIIDNKYIKEAEKIFNTKIDKIILNKEK